MAIQAPVQSSCRIEARQDGLYQIRCGDEADAPLILDKDGGGLSKEKAEAVLSELTDVLLAAGPN
jgi:hypothetical protein